MEEQNNQNSQFKWDRNKILLAAGAVVLVVAITLSYWMLKKDPETAQGDGGMKYEAVPAAVLNVSSNALWVSFPLDKDEKKEFAVTDATSIVRLDFTSAGPQETKIGLAELKQNDSILIYYKVKDDRLELNRVEFLSFPSPPVITDESKYRVLSVVNKGSYHVKNLASNKEIDLMVPSDAKITGGQIRVGSILKVNRSSVLGNGVLVFNLNVE